MSGVFFVLIKIKISTGQFKGYIARMNLNFKLTDVKLLIEEAFHRWIRHILMILRIVFIYLIYVSCFNIIIMKMYPMQI